VSCDFFIIDSVNGYLYRPEVSGESGHMSDKRKRKTWKKDVWPSYEAARVQFRNLINAAADAARLAYQATREAEKGGKP
jgi:hypothetical protein